MKTLERTGKAMLELYLGDDDTAAVLADMAARGDRLPSRTLILEGRARLDVAAMLMERVLAML